MRNWLKNLMPSGRGRREYFVKLLLSSLLILAVPELLMGSCWYIMGRDAEEKQALSQEQHHMDLICWDVGSLVNNVEQDIISLEYGKVYQDYRMERTPSSTLAVTSEMTKIKNLNNGVDSVYFYDKDREWIYTTDGQAKSIEDFYDTEWLDNLEQKVSIQHLPVRDSVDDSWEEAAQEKGLSSYYQKQQIMSIVSDGNRSAYFVVNLNVKSIAEDLYRKYSEDNRELYLTDSQGNIIYGCGPERDVLENGVIQGFQAAANGDAWWNADGSLYYTRQIGYDDIYCVEKISHDLIYDEVKRNAWLILSLIGLIVLGAAVFSAFVARKLYEPIGNLYQNLQKNDGSEMNSGDEITVITKTVRELNQSRENGELEIARQRDLLQAEMLRLLLNGMITREDFLKETLLKEKTDLEWRFLVCRMKREKQTQETEIARNHLKEALNTWLTAKNRGIFTEYQYGVYVALYQEDASQATVIYQVLQEMIDVEFYCSISEGFRLSDSIQEIFQKADNDARNKQFFGDAWQKETVQNSKEISVTNYEAHLIRDILLENSQGIQDQLTYLAEDFARLQNREKVLEIAQRIFITVDKECRTKENADGVREISVHLQKCENLADLISLLENEFTRIYKNIKSNDSNENEYYTRACAYIQENYNRNINISDVSDYLNISYAYLSKIFKSQSENGEKLLDYLNRIRIEKAKQLLAETDDSLLEVAEKVGYNNTQSLQRFFKKYESVTPGDWRKMQDKK